MSIVEWYKRLRTRQKGFSTSAVATALLVPLAYLSAYMASPKGVLLDGGIISIVAVAGVILNYEAKHNPKIRGSGVRWLSRSNSSIIWLFGVVIGALSGAIPTLIGYTPQYPVLALVLVIFLGFVFMTADLYKETDELVKPESKT